VREGKFIKQNLGRWEEYQKPADNPDDTADRFIHLIDDLSYAKTFYPSSNTVRYINNMAAKIFVSIYKNKKEKRNRLVYFWSTELPLIFYKHRRTLLFSFVFFMAFVLMGIFSAAHDPDFVRAILGDSYVDMTESNIAKGDPFAVYKESDGLFMFFQIAFNNIWVSFRCYAQGIFFSIGTVYALFSNGLMLGVFEYMFYKHHLGTEFFLVVFIHGTLEISALVISGAAGFILGNSVLFPGTYTRMQSLRMKARDSVKIIVSLMPVFITAAIFESFVTRHTEMPLWLNLSILGASLTFVVWYYIIYPIIIHKRLDAPAVS
jgi:uncharacterized membrane protein SpoIIM required for sporulation